MMNNRFYAVLALLVLVAVALVGTYFLAYYYLPDWQTRANFGGLFGVTTSVFSGFAFVFLLANFWVQKDTLEVQESARLENEFSTKLSWSLNLVAILLQHYRREKAELSSRDFRGPEGAVANQRILEIESRIAELEKELDSVHENVVKTIGEYNVRQRGNK